ncbi:glycerol kinase [Tolypothrix sp. NIES-4075]|nr:glycerol kinase [Tolypothrix sp. NIES-4075]
MFGHGCASPGLMKCTYGTGSFLVAYTGSQIVRSQHQLISTVAWTQTTHQGTLLVNYVLEGKKAVCLLVELVFSGYAIA